MSFPIPQDAPSITVSELLASVSLAVALCSLGMSLFSLRGERGRLEVSICVATDEDAILIRVVNSGRRPLFICSAGGKTSWHGLRWFFSKLTLGLIPARPYVLSGPELNPILPSEGHFRRVGEGEAVSWKIAIPGDRPSARELFKNATTFGVTDTAGKTYEAPEKTFRKFRKDLKRLVKQLPEVAHTREPDMEMTGPDLRLS